MSSVYKGRLYLSLSIQTFVYLIKYINVGLKKKAIQSVLGNTYGVSCNCGKYLED